MTEVTEIELLKNKENEIKAGTTIMPSNLNIIGCPRPGGALQCLADLAAAIAAEDLIDNSDSDYDDESDTESDDSDYFSIDIPFRARRASLPAVIEAQKVTEAATAAMRKLWTQRMARRSMYL
uniref:Uncharacterized protein n=1 Tax=Bactrocera latifrons TaxID=174628 RepID=A0A0K8VK75_BACLA